ncbi:MAG TPA: recombinase family protein [Candidatus Borkfalkia faecavium]|uniref:Recombinase family protein n=1 Tax=Candidatus Borkfalkia faecavium TaxID=2838508 RepID=A0A9D1W0R0_9FIRM|nr:recombinase family protein [Candidatus Borkfalkia faecavium]
MPVYGYARAQAGKSLKRQVMALSERVERENIVTDAGDTAGLAALKEKLQAGDLLVVKSLDQLGNNYEVILREWRQIAEVIGADILVQDLPLIDTRKEREGIPVSGIVQQILGFAAERDKERTTLQAQGIRKAKERGVRFGRPRVEYTEEFIAAAEAFRKKQITLRQALERTGIKKSSFYYHLKRLAELGLISA